MTHEQLSRHQRWLRDASGGNPDDLREVSFEILGPDVDPAEITRVTGLTPDRSRVVGAFKRSGLRFKTGRWSISSGLPANAEVHEQFEALLNRLRGNWSAFIELGRLHELEVWAAVEFHEVSGPAMAVVPHVGAAFAELNARIVFDVHNVRGSSNGREIIDPEAAAEPADGRDADLLP
jgi:hypothetical protein